MFELRSTSGDKSSDSVILLLGWCENTNDSGGTGLGSACFTMELPSFIAESVDCKGAMSVGGDIIPFAIGSTSFSSEDFPFRK